MTATHGKIIQTIYDKNNTSFRLKPYLFQIFIVFIFSLNIATAQESTHLISLINANKIISSSTDIPSFKKATNVSLPDHWQHDSAGFYGSVWYEIDLGNLKTTQSQWGIYLPEINMNAEVWLNDVRLGSGGSMKAPISRYWHSPLMFIFSPNDLKESNKLYIRVVAYANQFGQLGEVILGDRNDITDLYNSTFFNTVTIHIISGILAAAYALFIFIIWWTRRDVVFFWAALVCAFWSISSLNLYIVNPIFSELIWEKIMQISMGWIPLLFFFFISRINNIQFNKLFENAILLIAASFNLAIIFSNEQNLFLFSKSFHLFTLIWGFASVAIVFVKWLKYRDNKQLALVIAFFFIGISGLHDILVQNKILESGQAFWLDYGVPIILLFIGYLMVQRFLNAVDASEKLNNELESRVDAAHAKIQSDYDKILSLETEQASQNERERIYRNMHDDMGAKLLSLVYKSENDEMSDLARSAMNDLRAIVSKKQSKKYLLSTVLEKWQESCKTRCIERGFSFTWQQNKIPKLLFLSADNYKNMQRLQTESLTNAIKHSSGNQIAITAKYRYKCLQITVFDNGDFSKLPQWIAGRGMNSMRFRITQLNGKIHWQAHSNGGGSVRWIIPIHAKKP